MRLKNKVIVVTGGTRGLGKSIVTHLAREGAIVYCNFLKSKEEAESLVREGESRGERIFSIQTDVANLEEVERMVDEIYRKWERIDVLVNNAGVTRDELLLSMAKKDWDLVINTNLGGVFNCTKAVAKYMITQKSGRIINISSVAGERGGRGQSNYAASKGGINAFTRAVAMELAPKGITVNAIAPGVIETDMSSQVIRRARDVIVDSIALRRMGKAEEIAHVVVFMASDESSYITGEIVHVDGGFRA
ncbi:MAG: 3-oxoacyl-ACP reductase FabG [Proteobacteria bacterium]|nr:3-oxoacyl-ACP reductase FabG [Pseudomonadota bacterium]